MTSEAMRRLKAELAAEIQVAGPVLAQSLTEAGLIDEYRLPPPVVLGGGKPFFAGPLLHKLQPQFHSSSMGKRRGCFRRMSGFRI